MDEIQERDILNIDLVNQERNNILFLIAIDQYEHVPKLNNAVRDADDILDVLTRLYQFNTDRVIKIYNEEATENNIRLKFSELIGSLNKKDNIVIYFSGHGHFDPVTELGYWIPVEGEENAPSTYISNNDIAHYLKKLKAHHILLIVDACFSGSMLEIFRDTIADEEYPSRLVFTSGKNTVVSDGEPGKNSPFASAILSLLRFTTERSVGSNYLIQKVKKFIKDYSKNQNPDHAVVTGSGHSGGQFFFHKKLTEEELWHNAKEVGDVNSYSEYLELFPDGSFVIEAVGLIRKLNARNAWKNAAKADTVTAYQNFIEEHPSSDLVEAAMQHIVKLEKAKEVRLNAIKKRAEADENRANLREKFLEWFKKGERAFLSKTFKDAQHFFHQSLKYHIGEKDFSPTRESIEERIRICNDHILFREFVTEGDHWFERKGYELAIDYYKKALEISPKDSLIKEKIEEANNMLVLNSSVVVYDRGGEIKIKKRERRHLHLTDKARKSSIREKIKKDELKDRIKISPKTKKLKPNIKTIIKTSRKKVQVKINPSSVVTPRKVNRIEIQDKAFYSHLISRVFELCKDRTNQMIILIFILWLTGSILIYNGYI